MTVFLRGAGAFVPEHRYSNSDICEFFGINPERGSRYGELLGVHTRPSCIDYRNGRQQTITADEMAFHAAKHALNEADLMPTEVDTIICTSSFFDFIAPSISSRLLKRFGLSHAQTFDLMGGCAAFLQGLHLARILIETGAARNVLITSAEVITAWWKQVRHPLEYFIFGDTGGAFLLSNQRGTYSVRGSFVRSESKIDGEDAELIAVPIIGGKVSAPLYYQATNVDKICASQSDVAPEHRIVHNARQIALAAPRAMIDATIRIMREYDVSPDEVYLVPHQASRNVLDAMLGTGVPASRIGISLPERGNLSTSSIPVTFCEHRKQAAESTRLIVTSVGVGMTFGAMLFDRVG